MALAKQLIRMDEGRGPLVEVEVDTAQAVQAASRGDVWEVQKSFGTVSDFLQKVILPFTESWRTLSEKIDISEAVVKLSVGVSATGNFFLAKGESSANLEVVLKFIPKSDKSDGQTGG